MVRRKRGMFIVFETITYVDNRLSECLPSSILLKFIGSFFNHIRPSDIPLSTKHAFYIIHPMAFQKSFSFEVLSVLDILRYSV